MNVSLGPKWEKFVGQKIEGGDYQNASEVVRDALRLLEKQDLLKRISVSSLAELESKLSESLARFERGEGIKGEEAFRRLKKRVGEKRNRG
jgi:antitoxin ParD1/3/4